MKDTIRFPDCCSYCLSNQIDIEELEVLRYDQYDNYIGVEQLHYVKCLQCGAVQFIDLHEDQYGE